MYKAIIIKPKPKVLSGSKIYSIVDGKDYSKIDYIDKITYSPIDIKWSDITLKYVSICDKVYPVENSLKEGDKNTITIKWDTNGILKYT